MENVTLVRHFLFSELEHLATMHASLSTMPGWKFDNNGAKNATAEDVAMKCCVAAVISKYNCRMNQ